MKYSFWAWQTRGKGTPVSFADLSRTQTAWDEFIGWFQSYPLIDPLPNLYDFCHKAWLASGNQFSQAVMVDDECNFRHYEEQDRQAYNSWWFIAVTTLPHEAFVFNILYTVTDPTQTDFYITLPYPMHIPTYGVYCQSAGGTSGGDEKISSGVQQPDLPFNSRTLNKFRVVFQTEPGLGDMYQFLVISPI